MRRPNKWGRRGRQKRREEAEARQAAYDKKFPTPEDKAREQERRKL